MWRRLTWEQFERATKFIGGMTLGILETMFWGARPSVYVFVAAMLGLSEVAKLIRDKGAPDQ